MQLKIPYLILALFPIGTMAASIPTKNGTEIEDTSKILEDTSKILEDTSKILEDTQVSNPLEAKNDMVKATDKDASLKNVSTETREDCQKPCPRIRRYNRQICASDGNTYWNECTFEIAKCEAKLIDVTLIVKNNGPCNYKRPKCQKPCPKIADRPICASDGNTYWNECTFEIAKCEAKLIDVTLIVKNNGPCNYKRPGETGSEHEESNYDHAGNEGLFIHINNPSSNYDYEYINNPSSGETESKDEGSNYDKNSGINININNPTSGSQPMDGCMGAACECPPGMSGVQPFCQPE